jgi:hypothetical protein
MPSPYGPALPYGLPSPYGGNFGGNYGNDGNDKNYDDGSSSSYGVQPNSAYGGSSYGGNPYGGNSYGDSNLLGGLTSLTDANRNGIADHLEATKSKIDDYLAKTYTLGNRKLTVAVDYLNTPLEYQYLNQYHGFQHPLAGTQLGSYFNIPSPQQQNYQTSQPQYQQQTSYQTAPAQQYQTSSQYQAAPAQQYQQQTPYQTAPAQQYQQPPQYQAAPAQQQAAQQQPAQPTPSASASAPVAATKS